MPRVAAGADGRAVFVDHAAVDQMLGNELDGRRQPGEVGYQSLDQAIRLVEQADDRLVRLQADQLAHQAVLLGGQFEPEAAIDVLGGGPVAETVHGGAPMFDERPGSVGRPATQPLGRRSDGLNYRGTQHPEMLRTPAPGKAKRRGGSAGSAGDWTGGPVPRRLHTGYHRVAEVEAAAWTGRRSARDSETTRTIKAPGTPWTPASDPGRTIACADSDPSCWRTPWPTCAAAWSWTCR